MVFYIGDNKDLFDNVFEQKEEIESKLGFSLQWERLDDKKTSRMKSYIPA